MARSGLGEGPGSFAHEAEDDEQGHVGDEEVRGDGEHPPRLADAPEVAEGQDHHEGDREGDGIAPEGRGGRNDRIGPRRHRHRDGDGVADEEGSPGDLGQVGSEVVAADHVGAACLGVGADHVAVTDRHDGEDRQDGRGHRGDDGERGQSGDRNEDPQHLLGGVGRRGHDVGGKHGERRGLAQPLALEVVAHQGRPQQDTLHPVTAALREIGRQRRVGPGGRSRQLVSGANRLGLAGRAGRLHGNGLPRCGGRGESLRLTLIKEPGDSPSRTLQTAEP